MTERNAMETLHEVNTPITEPLNTHRPGKHHSCAGTDWICGSRYEKNRSLCKLWSVWFISMATGPPILTQNARYAFGSEDSMFCPSLINKTQTHTRKHTDTKTIQRARWKLSWDWNTGVNAFKNAGRKLWNLTDVSACHICKLAVSLSTRHI